SYTAPGLSVAPPAPLSLHRARSPPGRAHLPASRRHVSRPHRRDGPDRRDLRGASSSLHASAALGGAAAGSGSATAASSARSVDIRSSGRSSGGGDGTLRGGVDRHQRPGTQRKRATPPSGSPFFRSGRDAELSLQTRRPRRSP